jgi:3-hydroxyisobutyrate dehydrogenase-like beta-hydroxyacid dehydrogenase
MFLTFVQLCGLLEAKYWAEALGIEHRRSFAYFSQLFHGPNADRVKVPYRRMKSKPSPEYQNFTKALGKVQSKAQ